MDLKDWLIIGLITLLTIVSIFGLCYGLMIMNKEIEIEEFNRKVEIIEKHNFKPELVKILINQEEKER